jgi:hypothetical protein
MGLIKCSIHGFSGVDIVCSHMNRDIENRTRLPKVIRVIFSDVIDAKENLKYDWVLRYCSECAVKYNFPPEDSEISEEKYQTMCDVNFYPCCGQCFKELSPDE